MMPGPLWTDEKVLELRALWARGWSASRIGGEMGITRNTVLGKKHRLKLESRAPCYVAGGRKFVVRVRAPARTPPSTIASNPVAPTQHKPKPSTIASNPVAPTQHKPKPSTIASNPVAPTQHKPKPSELTKAQLRAQITAAILNTGGHL